MSLDIDDLNESDEDFAIKHKDGSDGLLFGEESTKKLFNKTMKRYDTLSRFWAPRLELGKKCQRFLRRDIFTPDQRAKYTNVQDKITVEPQEMKPVINALVGAVSKTVRSGAITMEDSNPPDNVAKPDTINVVIKWWENTLHLARKKKKALREALITGYPTWLWFERAKTSMGWAADLKCDVPPWDSTLPSPFFMEDDGIDIDEVMFVSHRTKWEMLEMFPDRKDAWQKHFEELGKPTKFFDELLTGGLNALDRSNMFYNMLSTGRYNAIEGHLFVIQRVFRLHTKRRIYVHNKTMETMEMPPEWEEWQKGQWKAANPEFTESFEDDVKTLWVTTVDASGFVWQNDQHWFQREGKLPGSCYIASVDDKLPSGAGEDMLPYILAIAVSETEGLAQVRTGTGTTTFIKEGKVIHPTQLGKELSAENGVVFLKKEANIDQDLKLVQRNPNETYHKMSDRTREQLTHVTNVTPAFLGNSSGRDAAKAQQAANNQALITCDPYIENYTNFNLNTTQLLCDLMPYALKEYQLIQISDEFGKKIPAQGPLEVNKPQYDIATGDPKVILNDLSTAKYRVIPIPSDDSPTNREQELKDFVQMIQAVGNTLLQIDPRIVANIWKNWPNKFAREAAAGLEEFAGQHAQEQQQAQQKEDQAKSQEKMAAHVVDMEKIKRPRWNIRLQPSDYDESPEGFRVMMQTLGAINSTAPDMTAGAQQSAQPQQAPAMATA
jgi:hypothetical protein